MGSRRAGARQRAPLGRAAGKQMQRRLPQQTRLVLRIAASNTGRGLAPSVLLTQMPHHVSAAWRPPKQSAISGLVSTHLQQLCCRCKLHPRSSVSQALRSRFLGPLTTPAVTRSMSAAVVAGARAQCGRRLPPPPATAAAATTYRVPRWVPPCRRTGWPCGCTQRLRGEEPQLFACSPAVQSAKQPAAT